MLCSPHPLSNVSSPSIPAQIPSSLRCPAGRNQSTLHSFATFRLLHLFDTFHVRLLLYLFSFINSIVIYRLLLSKSPCMRCFRGQNDGQVMVLAFKYYFSYSAATYVKAGTISYSFSIHLFFSFLLPIKRHGGVGIIAHFFDEWLAG